MPRHLITGGARSGKSAFAEKLAKDLGLPTVYIATAEVRDGEMSERVSRHRKARPASWRTVEAGVSLDTVLTREGKAGVCIILDCLTLWLSRLIAPSLEAAAPSSEHMLELKTERTRLIASLASSPAEVLIVTNELGSGVTPLGHLSRVFVDEHGITNQRVAKVCDRVTLIVCGCPLNVKPGASNQAS